ncbi:hypothetical protein C500_15455 [Natrialba magadii ATCC 43099]|uniref:Uncharacterized protein n=1 Tax=Natrialba magadii (strain ATCC 43099 / DSM 3394 / CCM 3739 / CIP 104546 / IAM 13178 / JCM 8861 / NBRC 102185 / NCIMB 2190 / MS3) TaxID=547559 RepID=L9UPC7_NATMM|nr:hypothetical protein C500_15455 [Natrialba magadii ATCC 43099]
MAAVSMGPWVWLLQSKQLKQYIIPSVNQRTHQLSQFFGTRSPLGLGNIQSEAEVHSVNSKWKISQLLIKMMSHYGMQCNRKGLSPKISLIQRSIPNELRDSLNSTLNRAGCLTNGS